MNRSPRTRAVIAMSAASVAVALAAVPREAHAEGPPKIEKGLFLPVGLNLGYSANPKGAANGFLLGGEASLVWFTKGWWSGMYADLLRDFGEAETRTSVGLEAGYGPVGVDFGYLGAFRDELMHGVRVRGILTTAVIALYGGYARTWIDGRSHAEFGALLKLPLPILTFEQKRPPGPPEELPPAIATPPAPTPPSTAPVDPSAPDTSLHPSPSTPAATSPDGSAAPPPAPTSPGGTQAPPVTPPPPGTAPAPTP